MARKVTHLFAAFRSLGGVETVLRHHYAKDSEFGLESSFIIYSENVKEQDYLKRVHFLGLHRRSTTTDARRRFKQAAIQCEPEIAVYHSTWGMPFLADLDLCSRRILVLHGEEPGLQERLLFRREWLDGILCVSEPLRQSVLSALPHLASDRIRFLPYPIAPSTFPRTLGPLTGRPMVLGFCGRLVKEQKRIDRLSDLCGALDQQGLDYRLEFLGEGKDRHWLESRFSNEARFKFHGRKSGQDYWRILHEWDVIIFASDYEGLPIALLEAVSAGVIPVYPRIGSGADAYVRGIFSDLLYAPEDFASVAQTLACLKSLPEAQITVLRARCQSAAAPHLGNAYMNTFAAFLGDVIEKPPLARPSFPYRPFFIDRCSFATLERIGAIRRSWLRLLRQVRIT